MKKLSYQGVVCVWLNLAKQAVAFPLGHMSPWGRYRLRRDAEVLLL